MIMTLITIRLETRYKYNPKNVYSIPNIIQLTMINSSQNIERLMDCADEKQPLPLMTSYLFIV